MIWAKLMPTNLLGWLWSSCLLSPSHGQSQVERGFNIYYGWKHAQRFINCTKNKGKKGGFKWFREGIWKSKEREKKVNVQVVNDKVLISKTLLKHFLRSVICVNSLLSVRIYGFVNILVANFCCHLSWKTSGNSWKSPGKVLRFFLQIPLATPLLYPEQNKFKEIWHTVW